MRGKVCHLVLKRQWYDMIDRGEKTVEYRRNTPYWRKRILDANYVTFHRGYTNTTMTFRIRYKALTGPVGHDVCTIEIYLGERISG